MRAHVAAPRAWNLKAGFEKIRKPADYVLTQVKGGAGLIQPVCAFEIGQAPTQCKARVQDSRRIFHATLMTAMATTKVIINSVSMMPKFRASRATNSEVIAAARIERRRSSQAIGSISSYASPT